MSYEYLPKSLSNQEHQLEQNQTDAPACSLQTENIQAQIEQLSGAVSDNNTEETENNATSKMTAQDVSNLEKAEMLLKTQIGQEQEGCESYEQHVFLLGQLYYEHKQFDKSYAAFRTIAASDSGSVFVRQAKYQLAILGFDKQLDSNKTAFTSLETLAEQNSASNKALDLFSVCANYNLGLASFNGFNPNIASGRVLYVARDYWLRASGGDVDDLSKPTNVKAMDIFMPNTQEASAQVKELNFYKALAQCKLGQLYTYDSELKDEARAFFWHTEAAGNGNIESQGVLGVMYLYGIGCRKNEKSGLFCLKAAAGANNLYALGRLCEYYYKKKLYTHCLAYSKPYAVKFLHDTKMNILDMVKQEAAKRHCTVTFAIKGATLCAFYFARSMENGYYDLSKKSDEEQDDNDVLLGGVTDAPLKIYRACATIEPALMVDLQNQRLQAQI